MFYGLLLDFRDPNSASGCAFYQVHELLHYFVKHGKV